MDAQSRGGPHYGCTTARPARLGAMDHTGRLRRRLWLCGCHRPCCPREKHNDKVSEFEKQLTSPLALMFHRGSRQARTSETAPQSPRRGEYVQARLLTDSERGL